MLFRSLLSVLIVSTSLMQITGCGNKEKTEDVNVTKLAWEDEKAILLVGTSLKVKGNLEGNKPFTVSFSITDDETGKIVPQDENILKVSHENPPSGKTTLTLHNDMNTKVNAGFKACNGRFTLNVLANTGSATVSKPLHFIVQGGRDAAECRQKTNLTGETKRGVIYNIIGKDKGAFDLIQGTGVSKNSSDDSKDLADMTLKTADRFSKKFTFPNHATFAHTPGLSFDLVDRASAEAAYNGAVHTRSETDTLYDGTILIVKLNAQRGGDFYVLKVLSVRDNTRTGTRHVNDGAVEFAYRKL